MAKFSSPQMELLTAMRGGASLFSFRKVDGAISFRLQYGNGMVSKPSGATVQGLIRKGAVRFKESRGHYRHYELTDVGRQEDVTTDE